MFTVLKKNARDAEREHEGERRKRRTELKISNKKRSQIKNEKSYIYIIYSNSIFSLFPAF
jgi:hypothetical protein